MFTYKVSGYVKSASGKVRRLDDRVTFEQELTSPTLEKSYLVNWAWAMGEELDTWDIRFDLVNSDKFCPSCGITQTTGNFYKVGNSTPDGLSRQCQDCYLTT